MNQKGIAHIALTGLLFAGLVAGVYLVQQTQIFKPKAAEPIKTKEECLKEFPPRWEWYLSVRQGYCLLKMGTVSKGRCIEDVIDYHPSEDVGGEEGCLGRNNYSADTIQLGTDDNCESAHDNCNDPILYPNFPNGGYCYKDPNPDRGGPFYICTPKTEEQ